MEEETKSVIKEVAENTLAKMGFSSEVQIIDETGEADQEGVVCNIKVDDPGVLIGQKGQNLFYLQHIIRLLARKKTESYPKFIVDVNLYRHDRNESLVSIAQDVSKQVAREKRAVIMRPMSAYERRIVHMELANSEDVITESMGEGESRRVVVKPKGIV